jgi:hypothetical protein
MTFARRRVAHLALPVLLLTGLLSSPAIADAWKEPKFDPPVGSKWTINREVDVEKNSGGTIVGHTLKEAALLTIEAKTADGFIVTYSRQSSSYEGDAIGAAAQRIVFQAEQGLAIRVETDASGKPLRILNFDEVKAALKKALDAEPITTANPDAIAKMREINDRMLAVGDKLAAELYLDDLPTLAMGQNTGLKPGEIGKNVLPVANALATGLTRTVMMSIADADPATGKVSYLMTQTYDADAMRTLVSETVRQMKPAATGTQAMEQAIKTAVLSTIIRAQLDVEAGMTRELRQQSVISFRAPGAIAVTSENELVTIKPAE